MFQAKGDLGAALKTIFDDGRRSFAKRQTILVMVWKMLGKSQIAASVVTPQGGDCRMKGHFCFLPDRGQVLAMPLQ